MKAPKYERRELLSKAIALATEELDAPIDRLEVRAREIQCWSGGTSVAMAYDYSQGVTIDRSTGRIQTLPGSGCWEVTLIRKAATRGFVARLLARFR